MAKTVFHPDREQFEIGDVLACLGDPRRLAIVAKLADAETDVRELRCRDFSELGGKSNLT